MTSSPDRDRLLIVAPEGRDSSVLRQLLEGAGLSGEIDSSGEALIAAAEGGDAAGAIITDDAITRIGLDALASALERQPTWSDFPFIVLSRRGLSTPALPKGLEDSLNATVLERPLHPTSLISAARSAIRARHRQRHTARHLEELEVARGELKALADTLEQKVRDRTRDLASANDRLTSEIAERERAESRLVQAQKMEAVGQLTGGIAHDFNNLLTAVIGSLDLLLRRTDDERSKRLAGNALQAAERGAKLTAQLLAFSRRQRLTPTAVDLGEIVATMSDLLGRSLGPRIRLETRLEPGLPAALADPTQLEMILLNLAINARDAMPSGGTLTIATSRVSELSDSLKAELGTGDFVAVAVSDTGVGMPPSVQARAFEPFFTTKSRGKGTGLGLSQLYGFAKQSGGTARIDSREGEGTTVTVYLPSTDADERAQPTDIPHALPTENARILLVDDDDDVREAASAMLEELGYQLVAANGGEEALKIAGDQTFDLLLTDVVMPGMNGIQLSKALRRTNPDIAVLFATGYADLDEFGEDLDSAHLVRKPFRMTDLAARLSEALAPKASGAVVDLDAERKKRG